MDEVYPAIVEEVSEALCPDPSTEPPFNAKTEDEDGAAHFWRVLEVEDCWALCQSFSDPALEKQVIRTAQVLKIFDIGRDRKCFVNVESILVQNFLPITKSVISYY